MYISSFVVVTNNDTPISANARERMQWNVPCDRKLLVTNITEIAMVLPTNPTINTDAANTEKMIFRIFGECVQGLDVWLVKLLQLAVVDIVTIRTKTSLYFLFASIFS